MSGSIQIYPFENTEGVIRFGVQFLIFAVGLWVAYRWVVRPALRIMDERKRRTEGYMTSAGGHHENVLSLEEDYNKKIREGMESARELRAKEIQQAQHKAAQLVAQSHQKSQRLIQQTQARLRTETEVTREFLEKEVDGIVRSLFSKFGLVILCGFVSYSFFSSSPAWAGSGTMVGNFWYDVFWPYFQFAIFIAAFAYWGIKPLHAFLEKRRFGWKAQLDEAREQLRAAEKKLESYKSKLAAVESEIAKIRELNQTDASLECEKILQEAAKTSEVILQDAARISREMIAQGQDALKRVLFAMALEEFEKRWDASLLAKANERFQQEALGAIQNLH